MLLTCGLDILLLTLWIRYAAELKQRVDAEHAHTVAIAG
jgi:hypothetical protein